MVEPHPNTAVLPSSEVRVDVTGKEFDVVVVGGGVGGVAAVRKLASAGLAVALVEDRLVGGECHYWACNPSRTLLRPIEVFNLAKAVPGVREAISGEGWTFRRSSRNVTRSSSISRIKTEQHHCGKPV